MPYRHALFIYKYRRTNKKWRYRPILHSERRNPFRACRSQSNRCIQTTSRNLFRYHFVLPTNDPLCSLQSHEVPDDDTQPDSFALVLNTPEATDTASARIYSVYTINRAVLCPQITAATA